MLTPYTNVYGPSLHRLLVVYDRLTPAGAAVALASQLGRESTEGAPGRAIKPRWIPQPGSVLTGTDHNIIPQPTLRYLIVIQRLGCPFGESCADSGGGRPERSSPLQSQGSNVHTYLLILCFYGLILDNLFILLWNIHNTVYTVYRNSTHSIHKQHTTAMPH